jgi:hypothetical protein
MNGTQDAGIRVFTATKIHFAAFWVVAPCSDVVKYHPEDGGSSVLRNVLPYHVTTRCHEPECLVSL